MHDAEWELVKIRGQIDQLKRENSDLKKRLGAITQLHNDVREKLRKLAKGSRT